MQQVLRAQGLQAASCSRPCPVVPASHRSHRIAGCGVHSGRLLPPVHVGELSFSSTSRSSVGAQAGRTSEPWWSRDNPPNMRDVHSIQELVDALADAGDRLVIVEFYATWCNACRAVFPKICRLVADSPDVVFLKMEFDENRDACRTLGVKVLPYFHFYRAAEGRVDAFSCTVSKVQKFKDALDVYGRPFCSLGPLPGVPEFPGLIAHPELHPQEAAEAAARAAALHAHAHAHAAHPDELHPLADTPTVVAAAPAVQPA